MQVYSDFNDSTYKHITLRFNYLITRLSEKLYTLFSRIQNFASFRY